MKKIILIASISLFIIGCKMNPNKEARIQKLETEIQQTTNKINELEMKVQTLESNNEQFKIRILELESR